jgi:hypothetical protein
MLSTPPETSATTNGTGSGYDMVGALIAGLPYNQDQRDVAPSASRRISDAWVPQDSARATNTRTVGDLIPRSSWLMYVGWSFALAASAS